MTATHQSKQESAHTKKSVNAQEIARRLLAKGMTQEDVLQVTGVEKKALSRTH